MRNQDGGPAMHHGCQTFQNTLFRQGVHARERVIQDQHPWIAQHRAGDGHPLLLPARKREPALSDHGAVAVRKARDIGSQTRQFRRARDLPVGSGAHAPRDVFPQRRAEQERFLRNEADLTPDFRRIEIPQVHAVHQNRAGGGIHQARDQAHQRALPAARVAHDRHR